jgi:hypothetical protein
MRCLEGDRRKLETTANQRAERGLSGTRERVGGHLPAEGLQACRRAYLAARLGLAFETFQLLASVDET